MLYLMNERQQEIIYTVNEVNQISVNALAEQLNVSVVTIRHDLNFLEQNGYLKWEHGYAVAVDEDKVPTKTKDSRICCIAS